MSPLNQLLELTAHKNPKFINNENNRPIISLTHNVYNSATDSNIKYLQDALNGVAPELIELYKITDGLELFANVDDQEECFFILDINNFLEEKNELEEWLKIGMNDPDYEYGEECGEDGELELFGIPPWWDTAVVFAGWGYAPERFFVVTEGPNIGEVFHFDHESNCSTRIAMSINELFSKITREPVSFIQNYGVMYYNIEKYEADSLKLT